MLIGLFKDSVLRCFCHTCSVNTAITGHHLQKKPISKKSKKPRCKQPKRKRRFHAATEIRCEEKSRGGMCYEVILAEPIADKPAPKATTPTKQATAEDIDLKLQQADDRRKSMEFSRVQSAKENLLKLEEAYKKREETNSAFIRTTHAALEDKQEHFASNRNEHLRSLKAKVSEHLDGVKSARQLLAKQSEDLRNATEAKLTSAQENRDGNIRKILDKLKEHDEHAKAVKFGHDNALRKLEEKIQEKLDAAESKRLSDMEKKLEMMRKREKRAEIVRANKEQRREVEETPENASSG